mmetsp:Transcript_68500/g.200384  ORF Transcript_68500/g.200384 Transcript_68500/m.200384 type:complete len:221 (+) Transcript_68500:690-1352(+)
MVVPTIGCQNCIRVLRTFAMCSRKEGRTPPGVSHFCDSRNSSVSSMFARMYITRADGTAPSANKMRQIASRGIWQARKSNVKTQDNSMPQPCIENTAEIRRPRVTVSEVSATMVAASGYSPPTPMPRRKRHSASCITSDKGPSVQTTHALPKAPKIMRKQVSRKDHFLPSQSPSMPNPSWPATAPASVAAATRLRSAGPMPPSGCVRCRMESTRSMTKRS